MYPTSLEDQVKKGKGSGKEKEIEKLECIVVVKFLFNGMGFKTGYFHKW
jgi:hypothetical protein